MLPIQMYLTFVEPRPVPTNGSKYLIIAGGCVWNTFLNVIPV